MKLLKHPVEKLLYFIKTDVLKKKGKRRYIHPRLGVEGFFQELRKWNISYSVLRWFETLPHVDEGEDIDILFADSEIHKIENLFKGTKSHGIPCDLYTASGLPGTSFRGIAYFPEHLANEMLSTTDWQEDLIRVPNPRSHYLSMIYHILYHKGYESGLVSSLGEEHSRELPDPETVDHDYPAVLLGCAEKAGMELPDMTLESLDDFLKSQGWQPSMDALEKLSARNLWIRDRFFAESEELESHWKGFSVFIVRERGMEYLEVIRSVLFDAGFEILLEESLDGAAKEQAAKNLRGGNWNRGPWPVSGGLPAHVIAVNDSFPLEPSKKLKAKHQGLANSRLWDTKIRIRNAVNARQPKEQRSNILHSADNPRQALEYFHTALSETGLESIRKKLDYARTFTHIPYAEQKVFAGHSRRAKVALVKSDTMEGVVKIYRPGRERFLHRELLARELGKELPETVPVLDHGESWFLMPNYKDTLNRKRLLPLKVIKRTREIILHYRKKGYELIDFKPKNLILDADDGLKIIDFEFMQQGSGGPSSEFIGNYCWFRIPESFKGDVPVMRKSRRRCYYRFWFSSTGLPLFSLMYDFPLPVLAFLRIFGRFPSWGMRFLRSFRPRFAWFRSRMKRLIIDFVKKVLG